MKKLFLILAMSWVAAAANVTASELGERELELARQEAQVARHEAEIALAEAQIVLREADIEARMDEARDRLDEAAQRLAEVSREAYMKEHGDRRNKPVLGVLLTGSGNSDGLLLAGVTPDGGAVEAGLEAGDRLIAINGERLDGEGASPIKRLSRVLGTVNAGDTVQLEYVRDETAFLADVVTQQRRAHVTKMLHGLEGLDIELEELSNNLSGLVDFTQLGHVTALSVLENLDGLHVEIHNGHRTIAIGGDRAHLVDVNEGLGAYFGVDGGVLVVSSSDESELEAGDILLEVAGEEVTTVAKAYQALGEAEGEVEAKVRRKKRIRTIEIAANEFPRVRYLNVGHGPQKRVIRIERHGQDDVDVRIIVDTDE
ncbi:MAG: PDZ domain-containing protein [Gammaproteobacteria bacterium]|nr:PDZ domain-containing protein [Gammaproteobacteria bacterium]